MSMFHRKSRWQRAVAPLSAVDTKAATRSGATMLASALTMTVASAAVSALRRRQERS